MFVSNDIGLLVVVGCYGLLIGSFLNVVSLRVPEGHSVVFPPSTCPHCQHRLKAVDLVPVFSYIWLRGKCRYCFSKISLQYPLGELLTALLMVITAQCIGWSSELATGIVFVAMLVAVTLTDLRTMLIPDKILLVSMAFLIPLRIWSHPLGYSDYMIGALLGSGMIFALIVISFWILKKEGMGLGDCKLMIVVGWVVGIKATLLTLFLASFIGGLVGILLIVTKRAERGSYIPFGPYLALGAWISYLWGDALLDWYFGLYI